MDLRPGLAHSGGVSHLTLERTCYYYHFFKRFSTFSWLSLSNGIVSRQILYLAEGDQLGQATDILTVIGVYDNKGEATE